MKILVWGTGQYAEFVYEHVKYINSVALGDLYEIVGYIDNNRDKQGQMFCGKRIYSPSEICEDHTPIVIGVYYDKPIIEQIRKNIGGEYCSFFDFVYRDIYLERQLEVRYISDEIKNKLNVQCKLLNSEKVDADEYAGALFSLYSKNIAKASSNLVLGYENKHKSNIKVVALYYTRYSNGGVERVIQHHLKMFADNGYRVILFVDETDEKRDYSLPENVTKICLFGAKEGNYFIWMKQLYASLEQYEVDVLISHRSYWEGNFYLNIITRQLGIKFVIEIHNVFRAFALNDIHFYINLYKNTDAVICLSETDKKFWNVLGVKAWFVPNPIEKQIKRIKKYDISKRVLWIGRIENKQKRFMDVLDVAVETKRADTEVKFDIVGDFENDNFKNEVMKKIKECGLEDTIVFHGYIQNPSKNYEDADCLILTSEYEGFPMVIAEAFAHGIPVITYSMPYLDMYRYHKGYIEIPHGDTIQMSNNIINLLHDKERLMELSIEQQDVVHCYESINQLELWKQVFNGSEIVTDVFDEAICDNIERLLIEGYTNERI